MFIGFADLTGNSLSIILKSAREFSLILKISTAIGLPGFEPGPRRPVKTAQKVKNLSPKM
jgi:hypothetical protein